MEDKTMSKNNELLALMHDTMSPVNTIKGAASLIISGTLTREETDRMVKSIIEKADELNRILDEFYKSERIKRDVESNRRMYSNEHPHHNLIEGEISSDDI